MKKKLDFKTKLKDLMAIPHGKRKFLKTINRRGTLLDVGCGNNSPHYIKTICPDVYYVGLDIADYHQTLPNLADKYILTSPENFPLEIEKMKNTFDTVVSSHNLEHVYLKDRTRVLDAMLNALKPGGKLFLAFPSEKTVNFPNRNGWGLNYFHEPTHNPPPPVFDDIIETLKKHNFDILFSSRSYKPLFYFLFGILIEPVALITNQSFFGPHGTFSFWGFESIIWAQKS